MLAECVTSCYNAFYKTGRKILCSPEVRFYSCLLYTSAGKHKQYRYVRRWLQSAAFYWRHVSHRLKSAWHALKKSHRLLWVSHCARVFRKVWRRAHFLKRWWNGLNLARKCLFFLPPDWRDVYKRQDLQHTIWVGNLFHKQTIIYWVKKHTNYFKKYNRFCQIAFYSVL